MFLHWQAMGNQSGVPPVYNNWTFTRTGASIQFLTQFGQPPAVVSYPVGGSYLAYVATNSSPGPCVTYYNPIPCSFANQYTIEFYFRATTIQQQPYTYGLLMGTGANQIVFRMDNYIVSPRTNNYYDITFQCAGTNITSSSLASVTRLINAAWIHIALVKESADLHTLYVAGQQRAQIYTTIDDNPDTVSNYALRIFQDGSPTNTSMYGLVDLMRISNVARYNDSFTPGVYGNDNNTWFFSSFENTLQPANNPPP
jgi:hypothetical protein